MRIGVNNFYGHVLETLPKKRSPKHSIRKCSWAHVNIFCGLVLKTLPKKRSPVHSIRKCSWAHPDGVAHLLWVEVVVDEAVDDGGQLGLHQRVALLLDGSPEKASEGVAQLLGEGHNLVLSGVAGDEVVEVGDDVDADRAGQLVPALGHGLGGCHEGGQ